MHTIILMAWHDDKLVLMRDMVHADWQVTPLVNQGPPDAKWCHKQSRREGVKPWSATGPTQMSLQLCYSVPVELGFRISGTPCRLRVAIHDPGIVLSHTWLVTFAVRNPSGCCRIW